MWRGTGDRIFSAVILSVIVIELVGLGGIIWAFSLRALHKDADGLSLHLLIGVLLISVAAALLLFGYMLVFHAWSEHVEATHQRRLREWAEVWARALVDSKAPITALMPPEGVLALLRLGDSVMGSSHARLRALARECGVEARVLRQLKSRRILRRMEALEIVALGRLEAAFEASLALLEPKKPLTMMAARACSRTLAMVEPAARRQKASNQLLDALGRAELSEGAIRECFLLAEEVAPEVLSLALEPARPDVVITAAVEATGHLQVRQCVPQLVQLMGHSVEVRSAVLRAMVRLRVLPPEAAPRVLELTRDPAEFVRAHASRALALHPAKAAASERLWELLGDPSWWVRRAASQALMEMGAEGRAILDRATREHPDRFARHAAGITAGLLDTAAAAA